MAKTQFSKTPNFHGPKRKQTIRLVIALLLLAAVGVSGYFAYDYWVRDRQALLAEQMNVENANDELNQQLASVSAQLEASEQELTAVKSEDQFVRNEKLQAEIKDIQTTYTQALTSYEDVLDLRGDGAKTQPLEAQFGQLLAQLSKRNYASATASLQKLRQDVQKIRTDLANAEPAVPANVVTSNTAPGNGYARQAVETDVGKFVVDILSADLNSTRVQVETASDGDCKDNCPVTTLADYVGRSGGFAGINGPYFCPADYPSCAGKTNSFDTLLMNKKKTYFNSDNNVYSTVPAMIFSGSGARTVGRSLEWGRDTGVDAVIANPPLLVSGGEVAFNGDGDPKKGSRGNRSFIGVKDNIVYIGVVRGSTVAETAHVLKALGIKYAINLDSGGSTAFMVNGRYVAGPGRNTPFGIVLVRK